MPNQVRFLYNTLFTTAALSTVPADCEQEGWPVENLRTNILSEAWKSNGTGNVRLRIDLGAPQAIRALALASHDLKAESLVTITVYSDAWITPICSQEFEAIGALLGWLEGGWLEGGWLGYPLPGDDLLFPRVTSLFMCDQVTGGRYLSVDIANGDDEFYIGGLFLGDLFEPARTYSYGYRAEAVDTSTQDESLGHVLFTDIGEQYNRWTLRLDDLTDAEAIGGAFWQFARQVGIRRPFVVQVMDSTLKHRRLTTMVGQFSVNPASEGRAHDSHGAEFVIREVI